MSVILTTVASIFVFSIVILIHEFGHFVTARKCGIQVNEFSIGMGPAVFHRVKKGTQYSVRLLPIGGYVSMEGEDGPEEEEKPAPKKEEIFLVEPLGAEKETDEKPEGVPFTDVSVPKRMAVVSAGAIMNFVLGFVLLLVLVSSQP